MTVRSSSAGHALNTLLPLRPVPGAPLADSLSMAFLVLLEALSPVERAVFMLRAVFGYGYPDVARITGKTEVNWPADLVWPKSGPRRPSPATG
jgi:DNA-directed RNA polymerase specialized sigma24 family protein